MGETRKGEYGFDAPYVPLGYAAGGIVVVVVGGYLGVLSLVIVGIVLLLCAGVFLHATRRGKFRIWENALDELKLEPDASVLDLGCGRGAVLLAAARRLGPRGRAVGIDLWRTADQSGNALETTQRNAVAEGVADRVELHTGDLTELPFADGSFDVVLSSLAIHNIDTEIGRTKAIREAVRVLAPGGRIVLVDLRIAAEYVEVLSERGMTDIVDRDEGVNGWWSGPWMPTRRVTAGKPTARRL
jgi:SAM-dependent methyltransferase